MIEVKIVNRSSNGLPEYKTPGAAGCDLTAYLPDGKVTIQPQQIKLIPTGLSIELPMGYEAQVRSRSGLALKNGIIVLNAPGTVDADYRGEVGVIICNAGDKEFTIENGDRIAQMVIAKHEQAKFIVTDTLSDTERAYGGFGHSGVK